MQTETLKNLFKEESFEGLLFLATVNEKTPEETLRYIYQKSTKSTAVFQRAKGVLIENNALEIKDVPGKKSLTPLLCARPEPYLDYLKERVAECNQHKKIDLSLSDKEMRYLRFVFSSAFFRKTFFNTAFFGRPEYAYNVSVVLDQKGRAHAYDIFRWIDNIFVTMIPHMRELYNNGFTDLFLGDVETFLDYESPDNFVNSRMQGLSQERADQVQAYCNSVLSSMIGKYPHVQYMINNAIANNFFTVFNYKFSAKLYVIMDFDSGITLTDLFLKESSDYLV
jgi:hypothetical protein